MCSNQEYLQRHNEKIDFIQKMKLQDQFIAIYPKDLKNLNNIFKNFLNN